MAYSPDWVGQSTVFPLSYDDVVEMIATQTGGDVASVTTAFNNAGLTPDVLYDTSIPYLRDYGLEISYNSAGLAQGAYLTRGYQGSTSDTIWSTIEELNSNAGGGIVRGTLQTPLNTTIDATTGTTLWSTLNGGVPMTAPQFLFGQVAPAVAAASTGITLGKTIDSLLYNANPDFWDAAGMSALNPDTWSSITAGDDSFLAGAFNFIFGIDPETGNAQAYMDETAFAYLAAYMQSRGAFGEGEYNAQYDRESLAYPVPTYISNPLPFLPPNSIIVHRFLNNQHKYANYTISNSTQPVYCVVWRNSQYPNLSLNFAYISLGEFTVNGYNFITDVPTQKIADRVSSSSTNPEYYVASYIGYMASDVTPIPANNYSQINVPHSMIFTDGSGTTSQETATNLYRYAANVLFDTNTDIVYNAPIEGIGTQAGATTPNLDGVTGVPNTLAALQQQYPDLWNNSVPYSVVNPDGTVTTRNYVPVGWPSISDYTDTQPTTGEQSQTSTLVDPLTATKTLIDTLTKTLTQPDTDTGTPTNPPTTGDGTTPTPTPATGSASSLWAIYHPTQAQVDSFGAWLWSSDFIDQIQKIFNNPMESIIGLHKVYATPVDAGTRNIKVGYLDSGVSSAYITQQYVEVNCGSVKLNEYFGNVYDYDPYTRVMLYLPFCGIVQLNTGDVMRSTIGVKYGVDVLTGACLAMVNVNRDGGGGVLYQYAGNCAVQYPVSSGSYMGIVTGIASVAAGIAGAVATGGAILPAVGGAAGALMNSHTTVQHSGGFSGNAGAMGGKTPYLIVIRPQTKVAANFPELQGYPTNTTVRLSDCSGFVRVKSVRVDTVPATGGEREQIETILKAGVII
jgi:hypothetical protein